MDTKDQFRDIAHAVRWHRKLAGLTQVELAELAGVGKTVLFDIEHGKESVLACGLLKVLAALNLKIEIVSPVGGSGGGSGGGKTVP